MKIKNKQDNTAGICILCPEGITKEMVRYMKIVPIRWVITLKNCKFNTVMGMCRTLNTMYGQMIEKGGYVT
jgi:hypothetical protein